LQINEEIGINQCAANSIELLQEAKEHIDGKLPHLFMYTNLFQVHLALNCHLIQKELN